MAKRYFVKNIRSGSDADKKERWETRTLRAYAVWQNVSIRDILKAAVKNTDR